MRPRAEMERFCPYFQMGTCKFENDIECGKKHQLLKKHEIEFIKEKFEKRKKKKGDSKGENRAKSRGKSLTPQRSAKLGIDWVQINGKKVPYCCMKFKSTGKCDYEERTGKKCGFLHCDQPKFDDLCVKLAAE